MGKKTKANEEKIAEGENADTAVAEKDVEDGEPNKGPEEIEPTKGKKKKDASKKRSKEEMETLEKKLKKFKDVDFENVEIKKDKKSKKGDKKDKAKKKGDVTDELDDLEQKENAPKITTKPSKIEETASKITTKSSKIEETASKITTKPSKIEDVKSDKPRKKDKKPPETEKSEKPPKAAKKSPKTGDKTEKVSDKPSVSEKPSVAEKPSKMNKKPNKKAKEPPVSEKPSVAEKPSKINKKSNKEAKEQKETTITESTVKLVERPSQIKKKKEGKEKEKTPKEKADEKQSRAEFMGSAIEIKESKKKKAEKPIKKTKSSVADFSKRSQGTLHAIKSKPSQGRFDYTMIESFLSRDEEDEESIDSEVLLKTYDTKKKKGKKDKVKEPKVKEEVSFPKETEETLTSTSATQLEQAKKLAKKKEKKKGKSGDEIKKIEAESPLLKEIMTMKQLIEAEEFKGIKLESDEAELDKAKEVKTKKKAKKKDKKGKQGKLTAKQILEQQLEAEARAAREAAEEQQRLATERKLALEKEKREETEYNARVDQLQASCNFIENVLLNQYRHIVRLEKEQDEWDFYLLCSKLPDAAKCPDMSTYIHLWDYNMELATVEDVTARTEDVLKLLNDLDYLIDTADPNDKKNLENWKWIRTLFRQNQAQNIDIMTYKILRHIDANLNRIDIETADFHYEDDNFKTSIWLRMQLPVPLYNPRKPAKPRINLNFDNLKMEFLLPTAIDGNKTAINARYFVYDHLSDTCDSYEEPPIPEPYRKNLLENSIFERRFIKKYKWDRRQKVIPTEETGENAEPAPPEDVFEPGPDDDIPLVPYQRLTPSASEYFLHVDGTTFLNVRQGLKQSFSEGVINLRKYTILGGIYELNLLNQPPQPQDFVTMETHIACLYLPKMLEKVNFHVQYSPPAQREEGARREPEEIEEELKKQEEEMDKLIFITLKWPDHVIFLELPMVCQWDETEKCWTQKDIHDVKHNEEKCIVTFRTGRFGIFGLGTFRFSNLPYQTWELKPEANGTVTFQITAAILLIEFNVKEGLVAMTQLQNSPNKTMQDIIGKYMKLASLIKIMKLSGADIFPSFDTFCYVDGCCEKHWPTEEHLYYNMASISACYNFSWSRWNQTAGRRNIVMQMREYDHNKPKQANFSMVLVTPLQAKLINCTEVSQTFCTDGFEDHKFQANLYYLMRSLSNMSTRNKISSTPPELVYVLAQLLLVTRVIGFS